MLILQAYYEIKKEKQKRKKISPNLAQIRKTLFWDTDFNLIDWEKQYKAVIERVFDRGNESEKQELIKFYGTEKIEETLSAKQGNNYRIYKNDE
jgi:antitoxin HigA-1